MKKVLFLLILMMLVVPVKGLENDNNVIRKYKYYRLNKVLGPTVLKDEVNEEFPLIDEDSYIEGELSELSPIKPLNKDGREIYDYDGYHYLKTPKINTIEIKVADGEIINDIKIKSLNEDINYKSSSNILTGDEYVKFDLNGDFNLNDLIITGKSGDGKEIHNFNIIFKHDNKLISELVVTTFLEDITIYGDYSLIKEDAYEDVYSLDKLDTSFNLTYKGEIKLYQYQDYKYQSYKLEREYYDEYLTEPFEDYIYRDDADYIDIPIINNLVTPTNLVNQNPQVKEIPNITPLKENTSLTSEAKPTLSNTDKNSFKVNLPTQYQHVFKVNDKKTTSNVTNYNYLFDYLKIIILIILLILTLKLKNKVKEYSR